MTRHRRFEMVRALDDAARFFSWHDAGAAIVSLTKAPNDAGAMFGNADKVEFRLAGDGLVIALRTVNGATYFVGLRS